MNLISAAALASMYLAGMSGPWETVEGLFRPPGAEAPHGAESLPDLRRRLARLDRDVEKLSPQLSAQERLATALKAELRRIEQQMDEIAVLESLTQQQLPAAADDARGAALAMHATRLRQRRNESLERRESIGVLLADATARVDELRRRRSELQETIARVRTDLRLLELAADSQAAERGASIAETQRLADRLESRLAVQLKTWRMQREAAIPAEPAWFGSADDPAPGDELPCSPRRWLGRISLTAAWWLAAWMLMTAADAATAGYRRTSILSIFAAVAVLGAAWIWAPI